MAWNCLTADQGCGLTTSHMYSPVSFGSTLIISSDPFPCKVCLSEMAKRSPSLSATSSLS